jgi:hypothetical protein
MFYSSDHLNAVDSALSLRSAQKLLEEQVTIERIPDHKNSMCAVTINLPWDVADRLTEVFAPFIANMAASIELRNKHHMEHQARKREIEAEQQRKQREANTFLHAQLRRIHKEALCYWDFNDALHGNTVTGKNYYMPTGRQTQKMYARMRRWSISQRLKRGDTAQEIAEAFDVKTEAIRTVIRQITKNGGNWR